MNYNELAKQKASEYKTAAGPFDIMVEKEQFNFIRDIIAQKIYRYIAGKEAQQDDCIKDIQGYLRCMKHYCPNISESVGEEIEEKTLLRLLTQNDFKTYGDFKQVADILMNYFWYRSEDELIDMVYTNIFHFLVDNLKHAEIELYEIMGVTWE